MQKWPRHIHVALFCVALGSALFLYALISPDKTKTTQILVSASLKNTGEILGADDVTWASWPAAFDKPHYIHTDEEKDAVVNKALTGSISEGDSLTLDKVIAPNSAGNTVSQNRILHLPLDKSIPEASSLKKGDRVDILWTHKVKAGNGERYESQPLADNILVLGSDSPSMITLDTKPEIAQKILLAKEAGRISFLLRSPGCQDPSGLCTVTDEALLPADRHRVTYTTKDKTEQREIQ